MQHKLRTHCFWGVLCINVIILNISLISLNSTCFQEDVITIGIDRNTAPMEFEEQGVPKGFNVDLISQVAEDAGLTPEFIFLDWPVVLESVANGSLDMMFAIETQERREIYAFSLPILNISWQIFVKESVIGISSLADLTDRTIAVVEDFAAHQFLLESGISAHIVNVSTTQEAIELLDSGDVFAHFGNYHTGLYYIQELRLESIKTIGNPYEVKNMAFAVHQDNIGLMYQLNQSLNNVFQSNKYTQIYEKWYGSPPSQSWLTNDMIYWGIGIIMGIAFLFLSLFGWNYTLRKKIHQKTKELKQNQALLVRQDKIESLGVLAGGIAHDFNNFLTTILGNISYARVELEENYKNQSELNQVLKEAEQASISAQGLTQQLLTFAKGGAPIKQVVKIDQIIKEAAKFATRGASIYPIFDFEANIPLVNVDEHQIKQVIQNIVLNALQAMPTHGELKITLQSYPFPNKHPFLDPKTTYIEIAISDTGKGISAQDLPKIFDPYFTTKAKGTGLGLTVSISIIKNHGGEIHVVSQEQVGTTFYIYLPCDDQDNC